MDTGEPHVQKCAFTQWLKLFWSFDQAVLVQGIGNFT